eukprot:6213377-Pleurochrysis_carterae.AAC.1
MMHPVANGARAYNSAHQLQRQSARGDRQEGHGPGRTCVVSQWREWSIQATMRRRCAEIALEQRSTSKIPRFASRMIAAWRREICRGDARCPEWRFGKTCELER